MESVWPVAMTISTSTPFSFESASSIARLPSGRTTDLSKSKSASAWLTTDWRTDDGAGLAGAGGGGGAGRAGRGGGRGSGRGGRRGPRRLGGLRGRRGRWAALGQHAARGQHAVAGAVDDG